MHIFDVTFKDNYMQYLLNIYVRDAEHENFDHLLLHDPLV